MANQKKRAHLIRLKEDIEDSKEQIAILKGRRDSALEQLQNLGVPSIAKAKKKIEALRKEAEGLEDELHDMLADIEETLQ